jgi:Rps23 Pro-64 3,4-dihydroxylase Tpa1-like proline 4-hydroxylase
MTCSACRCTRVYPTAVAGTPVVAFCSYCKHNVGEVVSADASRTIIGTFLLRPENRAYVRRILEGYDKKDVL